MVRFMDLFVTRTYVVLSAIDDSVTFSPALLRKIRRHTGKDLRVLTVAVAGTNDYAFIVHDITVMRPLAISVMAGLRFFITHPMSRRV